MPFGPRVLQLAGHAAAGISTQVDAAARAVLDELALLMQSKLHTFDARGLANAAWAFAKVKYVPNQELPALIAEAAVPKLQEMCPQVRFSSASPPPPFPPPSPTHTRRTNIRIDNKHIHAHPGACELHGCVFTCLPPLPCRTCPI